MSPVENRADHQALTNLSEDDLMFQVNVRKFARERIAPHVREVDEEGAFREELWADLFSLGLMAIEIPEEFGGQNGTFFQSILAIEEF
jgi:alkylation response protein AidB-like acyl-CoA dehydrogenase